MDEIINELILRGFSDVKKIQSENFGDLLEVYKLNDVELRLVISKLDLAIDIRKNNNEWFDLGLVKSFLLNETKLNKKVPLLDYQILIKNSLNKILFMFNDDEYKETSIALKKMELIRVNQMFGL